jgi:aminopeptidase N
MYAQHPADDAFWQVKPGDPGAENQFDIAVYDRGALAIQALRNEVGEKKFAAILKGWPQEHAYGNAKVSDFVKFAEKVSGKPLAGLFDTWLYQPSKPGTAAAQRDRVARAGVAPAKPKSWKQIAATNSVHDH